MGSSGSTASSSSSSVAAGFTLPTPYTTTVTDNGTVLSEIISYFSTDGATGTTTSTIPAAQVTSSSAAVTSSAVDAPTFSLPDAYTTTFTYDGYPVSEVVSFEANEVDGVTQTATVTSQFPVDRYVTVTVTEVDPVTVTTDVTDAAKTINSTVYVTKTVEATVTKQ
ncbi:hypothetical protein NCAS_0G04320 [Naumovozyma castellii]|uniref:Uncharacterized protein n=1 Tax=Naumovozyma castellii TaxID=27288 RepID=G0VHL2_NAUCA|nr:hypothetical protein NCAS_0G04320 [Naumovozyma castellii CBS 4309]CCC71319.1 hypothetical protein NCAS_0G04320 [Naumovozyma castellii CBS 4309]